LEDTIFSKFEAQKPSWMTVEDAVRDLPRITNGGGVDEVPGFFEGREPANEILSWCRDGAIDLYNHVAHKTNAANISLIKHIPPGKNWKSIPEDLRPARFKRVALKDHTTTYGRLSWNMPARTITCYFNNITCGAFTHPQDHRGISIREGARLQSFPDSFRFMGSAARQFRQVGNAVPCLLASEVGRVLYDTIQGHKIQESQHLNAAVEFSRSHNVLVFNRPLKGMRFNLDRYLVTN
jgi:DNA (cytosine-5)-methyltransferase 1